MNSSAPSLPTHLNSLHRSSLPTSATRVDPVAADRHGCRGRLTRGQLATLHHLLYFLLLYVCLKAVILIGFLFQSLSRRTRGDALWPPERAAAFGSDAGQLALLHLRIF